MASPGPARWHAVAVFLALFALYAVTSPRTIALEDDGLFVLSSHFLGIAHPPGYPLFILIGKAFSLLPLGSIAYRVHLVSALFGATTCAVLWCLTWQITKKRIPAYTSAFVLGISPVFWSQSIIAEVYTVNAFLFFCLFFAVYRIYSLHSTDDPQSGHQALGAWAVFSAFLAGLGLANHWPLLILASPALLILAWPARRAYAGRWQQVSGAFACGLAPYAWMVLRSQMDPQMAFLGPIEGWGEFWGYINRDIFSSVDQSMSADWSDRIQYSGFLIRELAGQFTPLGLAMGMVGLWVCTRHKQWRLGLSLAAALLTTPVLLWSLLSFDYDTHHQSAMRVYPLVSYGVLALLIGVGIAGLPIAGKRIGERSITAGTGIVILATTLLLTGTVTQNTRSGYAWSREYAAALLSTLPENSAVFLYGDIPTSVIGYFHYAKGWRPDVQVYSKQGLLFHNRLFSPHKTSLQQQKEALNAFIERSKHPVFFTECHSHPDYQSIHMGLYCYVNKRQSGRDGYRFDQDLFDYLINHGRHKDLTDAWTVFHRNDLFTKFGKVLGAIEEPQEIPDTERYRRLVAGDFYGGLGFVDGLMHDRDNAETVLDFVKQRYQRVPPDLPKKYPAKIYEAVAWGNLHLGRHERAIEYLRASLQEYPHLHNDALTALVKVYRQLGREKECRDLLSDFGVEDTDPHCKANSDSSSKGAEG